MSFFFGGELNTYTTWGSLPAKTAAQGGAQRLEARRRDVMLTSDASRSQMR